MMARILVSIVKAYQLVLSPFFGQQCRFYPTCSHYAVEAIQKHGALRGSYYTVRRLLRCHPWCDGGHDPIP
jgi:putative membrane protein insertion efficiency factor